MFFGLQDTRRMTALFHSPNIDELMEAVCDGSRRKATERADGNQPSAARPQRASTSPSTKSRSREAPLNHR